MITINANEAKFLRKSLKDVHIYKTKKQKGSKRGFFYVEETNPVVKSLTKYRSNAETVLEEYPISK